MEPSLTGSDSFIASTHTRPASMVPNLFLNHPGICRRALSDFLGSGLASSVQRIEPMTSGYVSPQRPVVLTTTGSLTSYPGHGLQGGFKFFFFFFFDDDRLQQRTRMEPLY